MRSPVPMLTLPLMLQVDGLMVIGLSAGVISAATSGKESLAAVNANQPANPAPAASAI
jgi:hypothetical protein